MKHKWWWILFWIAFIVSILFILNILRNNWFIGLSTLALVGLMAYDVLSQLKENKQNDK
jgi:phosphoglycerol transferase MdoB-like AlkP superfamily enzyme